MTFIEVINWSAKDSGEALVIASDKKNAAHFGRDGKHFLIFIFA
jgi:hypothetical protein